MSIMYFNARSLVPKFDELCLIVETHNPDVLWSLGSVKKFQTMRLVSRAGYTIFCRDRNRHGGGVLLYIRSHFKVTMLPSSHDSLEILPILIHHLNTTLCITVLYRPPNSPNSIFDTLISFVASMNIHRFSHFVLIGDFNVNMFETYSVLCIIEFVV